MEHKDEVRFAKRDQETPPDARKLSRWLGHLTSIYFQLDVHSRAALATEIAPIVSDRPSRTASP